MCSYEGATEGYKRVGKKMIFFQVTQVKNMLEKWGWDKGWQESQWGGDLQ